MPSGRLMQEIADTVLNSVRGEALAEGIGTMRTLAADKECRRCLKQEGRQRGRRSVCDNE